MGRLIGTELRVLHVIDSLGAGGAERSLAEMLPRLSAAGIGSTVACSHLRQGAFHEEVVGLGVPVQVLPSDGIVTRTRQLRRIMGEVRPHLLHATLLESNLIARLAAFRGPPVLTSLVSTPYSAERFDDPRISTPKLRAVQLVDAVSARTLSRHFHAVSEAVKEAAVRDLRLPPDRVTVIPRGRDPRRLGRRTRDRRVQARRGLGLSTRDLVLLNVGRQDYQKGQVHLVEATARLHEAGLPVRTVIAGRAGTVSARLHALRRDLVLPDETLRLLGHRDDVPDLLTAADVFVFPSLVEGSPGALIEAMALEVPVVASDLPAVREVVGPPGRSAILVPPADTDALVSSIETLASDEERQERLTRRARQRYLERFTIDAVVEEMVHLYRRIARTSS